MKKRVLFSACALAACFAACTNDDFQTVKENAVVNEAGEVIGADLVSAGMTISSFGDKAPATRASVGENGVQWDANDETGLAWFQYDPAITAAQDKDSWYNTASGSMSNECSIFANHRFAYQGATGWQTVTDVYAGSYFAYWPYAKLGGAVPKEVSANQEIPQTADFRDEYLNKALRMSGQDFIEKNGRPPKHSHKEKEEKSLYVWLKSAREKALTGKLEPSQYEQLNGLGLIPSHPVKQPAFEERVQELSDFIRKEIRLPNIDSDSKEERSLYHWFHVTRKKVENNKLPKDQAKLFRDAGLLDANPWRQKRDKIWNQHLQDLITFYKDNSRLPKFQEPVNGFQLRFWYRKTTNLAKEGKLEANQVKKLQEFQELLQKDVE